MARVEVFFYGALKDLTGEKSIEIEASTIKDLINALITVYSKPLENRIYAEDRRLRRFVNFFINGKDIRFINGVNTELNDGDKIYIIPAIGGG